MRLHHVKPGRFAQVAHESGVVQHQVIEVERARDGGQQVACRALWIRHRDGTRRVAGRRGERVEDLAGPRVDQQRDDEMGGKPGPGEIRVLRR